MGNLSKASVHREMRKQERLEKQRLKEARKQVKETKRISRELRRLSRNKKEAEGTEVDADD